MAGDDIQRLASLSQPLAKPPHRRIRGTAGSVSAGISIDVRRAWCSCLCDDVLAYGPQAQPVGDVTSVDVCRQTPGTTGGPPAILCESDLFSTPTVSYTHLRAHETRHDLVCRLLLEKKKKKKLK